MDFFNRSSIPSFERGSSAADPSPAPPPPYTFITSLFAYKNSLASELIWNIKYKKNHHALRCGGYALYQKLPKNVPTILIPIPSSKKRRKERGYNQCELLIDEIIKLDSGKIFEPRFDILKRIKNIKSQTLKNRGERIKNTEDIFEVCDSSAKKPIILIDDVVTTGSTLKEAQETLLKAGYRNVSALTLAH